MESRMFFTSLDVTVTYLPYSSTSTCLSQSRKHLGTPWGIPLKHVMHHMTCQEVYLSLSDTVSTQELWLNSQCFTV